MKILLLGKNGQVGWELQRSLAPLGEVVALDRHSQDLCGDLADLPGLAADGASRCAPMSSSMPPPTRPWTRPKASPSWPAPSTPWRPACWRKKRSKLGAWLVHYSTDYVFDGSGSRPWVESDTPAPLSVYGQTKLEGEQLIAEHCQRHLILRTSWVYAARGGNFAKTMLRLAQERERLTVIDDQWGAPTGAELLADVTAHAIRQALQRPQDAGLYHLAASGETTWNGYAKHVIAQAQRAQASY